MTTDNNEQCPLCSLLSLNGKLTATSVPIHLNLYGAGQLQLRESEESLSVKNKPVGGWEVTLLTHLLLN